MLVLVFERDFVELHATPNQWQGSSLPILSQPVELVHVEELSFLPPVPANKPLKAKTSCIGGDEAALVVVVFVATTISKKNRNFIVGPILLNFFKIKATTTSKEAQGAQPARSSVKKLRIPGRQVRRSGSRFPGGLLVDPGPTPGVFY